MKVINFFASPGAGKSTLAAATFAELKFNNINAELVTEYAKDKTWQEDTFTLDNAQEYIFAKQHYRLRRLSEKVDYAITDAPILLSNIYGSRDLPSLRNVVFDAWDLYDNINFFVKREKPYNTSGRSQSEKEAIEIDTLIQSQLDEWEVPYFKVTGARHAMPFIMGILAQ